MIRGLVTGGAVMGAGAVIWVSFFVGVNTPMGTMLVNLGTEIFGIVMTVAVVEWFFERRRLRGRGREHAWDIFHSVQHVVWVWQGGPREMDTDEVRAVLAAVGPDDPIPDFTEGLLVGLGLRSRRLLNNDSGAIQTVPSLMNGLEELARLSSLRDGSRSHSPHVIASILSDSTESLAKSLGLPPERMLPGLIRYRDPSVGMQERRHFGGATTFRSPNAS